MIKDHKQFKASVQSDQRRLGVRAKVLISLAMGYSMTLLHYPLIFTGTGFSVMFYNAFYIYF